MFVYFVYGEPNEHQFFQTHQTLWLSWLDGRKLCPMWIKSGYQRLFSGWGNAALNLISLKSPSFGYQPPQPSLSASILNKPDRYFAYRFFLWMPRHLFHMDLVCPQEECNGKLTNAGVHQKTRMVLDVDSFYNMAGEYLSCPKCSKKVIYFYI